MIMKNIGILENLIVLGICVSLHYSVNCVKRLGEIVKPCNGFKTFYLCPNSNFLKKSSSGYVWKLRLNWHCFKCLIQACIHQRLFMKLKMISFS